MTDDMKFKLAVARDFIIILFVVLNFIAALEGKAVLNDKLLSLIRDNQNVAQACRLAK